ncbi:PspC domain-containing protein [Winkia sp. ACRQY]|uniref:PspC domain-containing protein n=1 Tax=unclassified Winkia TaxID=2692119 RepID=UPI0008A59B52|nr:MULTISPECIES: PspC domain-containing protein [unclassified Winkia]OFT38330.1 hypothetical protein HMPREF3163_07210 [Actinomyces sp. HMSC08A01]PMC92777.1 PspC domain-containing protein [Actinomyces sp. UMB0918]MCG7302990.1 PspC domain-containing protein [Winkia sp. ACRQY]MDK8225466.1 PspC domain-containing protein [Winkia sp. UMB750B]MDK8257398.1 PspC domain-containing protein [Winkia sp. UMB750A]
MATEKKKLSTKLAEAGWIRTSGTLGGVCQAITTVTGYDVNLVRVLTVVFAILFLPGTLAAYGFAWLLIPDETYTSHLDRFSSPSAGFFGAILFIVLAIMTGVDTNYSVASAWGALLGAALLALLIYKATKTPSQSSRPAPTPPAATAQMAQVPSKPLPPRTQKPALNAIGQLLSVAAALFAAALYIAFTAPLTASKLLVAFGIATAIAAAVALATNIFGRKSGLPGAVATLALILGSPMIAGVWAVPKPLADTPVQDASKMLTDTAFQLRAETVTDLNYKEKGKIHSHSYASDATVLLPLNWKGTVRITVDQGRSIYTALPSSWESTMPKPTVSLSFDTARLPLISSALADSNLQLAPAKYEIRSFQPQQTKTFLLQRGSSEERATNTYDLRVKGGRLTIIEGKIK